MAYSDSNYENALVTFINKYFAKLTFAIFGLCIKIFRFCTISDLKILAKLVTKIKVTEPIIAVINVRATDIIQCLKYKSWTVLMLFQSL